ncbi:alpha-2-macroglobulin family protein [Mucilaginibacter terrae]|uniref:Alpha-2-macroglobulin domain-containing protein n=1 Tax=Mucilaginibacter terrae TaxID=1955052 RepID=A0ABU3GRB2_9SPHI|nr:MG2 domain-containing protein [Mucilaginibacter terrae]MDT3401497.1 hypothetical protein [Mucilaginibacter terrae]
MCRFLITSTLLFILSCSVCIAQRISQEQWGKLESQLNEKLFLQDNQKLLQQWRDEARQKGNDIDYARALCNLIIIRDLKTEDSLYFYNSSVIDSVISGRHSSNRLQAIVHIMQAQRLGAFASRYHRFNIKSYHTSGLKVNYADLSLAQTDSLVNSHLQKAFGLSGFAFTFTQYKWLSTNPGLFLFEPSFKDFVLAERVNLTSVIFNHNGGLYSNDVKSLLSLQSDEFRQTIGEWGKNKTPGADVLKAYYDWMALNKADAGKAAFIESLARKAIWTRSAQDSVLRKQYINYLQLAAKSPYNELCAHAVYQLCMFWVEEGRKYGSYASGSYYNYEFPFFDAKYKDYLRNAANLYNKNSNLLKKYPGFNNVLQSTFDQQKSSGLQIKINQDHVLPDTPILLTAIYRNIDTIYCRLIEIGALEDHQNNSNLLVASYLQRKPVTEKHFVLPPASDYNLHAAYLKLDALPKGHYRLLFSNKPLKNAAADILNSVAFEVGNIAAINTDDHVFVLDRKTGIPLKDATLKAYVSDKNRNYTPINTFVKPVNKMGYTIIPKNTTKIVVSYNGDTTSTITSVNKYELRDKIYTPDEHAKDTDEDLLDYIDDNLIAHIFTDRSIYRPGQTVHYKMLFITKNPKTGESVPFCAGNFKNGEKLVQKWLKDNNEPVEFIDAFNKVIDTAKISINEFGSFSGSFVIPKNAATGEWKIEPGLIDTRYGNRGYFKVEEYKRPTFELVAEKPKKSIRPGKPFTVYFKLRSFSGATLNNVPVKYEVLRNGKIPDETNPYSYITIADTTMYADASGKIDIQINDTLLKKYNFVDSIEWRLTYTIKLKATDATGETAEVSQSVTVLNRPVGISIPMLNIYNKKEMVPFKVTTATLYEGTVGRNVNIKLYRTGPARSSDITYPSVDEWIYSKTDLKKWFPFLFPENDAPPVKELVYQTTVNTAKNEKLILPADKVNAGHYQVVASVTDSGKLSGLITYYFKVFDSETGDMPSKKETLSYLTSTNAQPGDKITWYTWAAGKTYSIYQVNYVGKNKKEEIINTYTTIYEPAGLRKWTYQIPKNISQGKLWLNRIYVADNKIQVEQKTIAIIQPAKQAEPEIIIEKYRRVMAPGATETFSVSVKTNNNKLAAELMTTLYDASLDKLEPHTWDIYPLMVRRNDTYIYTRWPNYITQSTRAGNYQPKPINTSITLREQTARVDMPLQGRLAGLAASTSSVTESNPNEIYTARSLNSLTSITIRGNNSLTNFNQPLVVLNGVVFEGNLKDIDPSLVSQAMVLKGAEASALYGSRASQGVLIISTQGPIVLPEPEKPVAKVRKNFNETAFFFPQVHAGTDGYYTFTFTMPESATEWNWKMLAHTKDARFAYLERKLQTQLNLMVQPNMPRLLYQGDRINLQSRISNLAQEAVDGTVSCKIEDAVTGQDITAQLVTSGTRPFKLNGKSSDGAGFMLQVPDGQQNPLKIVISVQTQGAADAEEHIIPVSTTRVFVRQSVPLHFGNEAQLIIPRVKMAPGSVLYGLGLSINAKPQAAVINALPWLANYSYNCAEQTFNKLKANVTALLLMRTDTAAQQAYKRAFASTATQQTAADSQLPDELAQQTMPWLNLGNQTAKQQQQLLKLLDTVKAKQTITTHIERLYDLQQTGGGLSWFDNGKSDRYISAYVLAGIRGLQKQGWTRLNFATQQNVFENSINNLAKYNLSELSKIPLTEAAAPLTQYMLYAAANIQDKAAKGRAIAIIDAAWKNAVPSSLDAGALLIINTLNHTQPTEPLYKKAVQLLGNIRQQAIVDEQNGMRWKDISDADELSSSGEETLALLAEAFELAGKNTSTQNGMVKWLLIARQDEHWQTTKGTSAAIDLLKNQKGGAFGTPQGIEAALTASQKLQVSNGLLSGAPAAFVKLDELPVAVNVSKQGTNVNGALSWYYFAQPDGLDTLNKGLSINRKLFLQAPDNTWKPITPTTRLKPGNKVRVQLTIEAGTRLKYVYINDPRAAAFEPQGLTSDFHYNSSGLSYYQSVRDAGMQFFADILPRGTSTISYELTVVHEGEFATGAATLQCMYKPNVTAYSNTGKVVVSSN